MTSTTTTTAATTTTTAYQYTIGYEKVEIAKMIPYTVLEYFNYPGKKPVVLFTKKAVPNLEHDVVDIEDRHSNYMYLRRGNITHENMKKKVKQLEKEKCIRGVAWIKKKNQCHCYIILDTVRSMDTLQHLLPLLGKEIMVQMGKKTKWWDRYKKCARKSVFQFNPYSFTESKTMTLLS
eukprot:TRINITY_DN3301_c2_g2_i2.p1 TRINITY_DN3301_c2_g2~~TRINITY_DN3301_c2_g2_i2.p1  ORF type:complete len:178 (+),score=20.51 TRINITY_DN3301_c2_g2_i2:76-609(+)